MSQGTLRDHLHANSDNERQYPPLNCKQRLIIALDVARGMEYLHKLANRSFIHRDLKPSNILLDDNMRPKVSDFGLAKLIPDGKQSFHTRIAGTFGYLAPDYAATGRVTTKADVYAFGVVLMELITGRKAVDNELLEDDDNLVSWFYRVLNEKESFKNHIDPFLDIENEKDMGVLYEVAAFAGYCTNQDPHQRPEMGHAVVFLDNFVNEWKPGSDAYDDESFTSSSFGIFKERLQIREEDTERSSTSRLDMCSNIVNTQTSLTPTETTDTFTQP